MNNLVVCKHKITETKQYFASIDGLRLFAAANVVLYHYETMGGYYELAGNPTWFFKIIKGPMFHASLFFILAGFIYAIKYAEHIDFFSRKRFIKSRLRDLYPLHLITTLSMVPFLFMNGTEVSVSKLFFSLFMHLSFLWSLFPQYSYTFNMPSWALSAFFFCYIFFPPVLKKIKVIDQKRIIIIGIVICTLPILGWSYLYNTMGMPNSWHTFFHGFAPIRFFEFIMGMLLARLFQIRSLKNSTKESLSSRFFVNDFYILTTITLLFWQLSSRSNFGELYKWISYHVFAPLIFCLLLYRFARGNGILAYVFALPIIRNLGKCSFYPYLLHIPLMSWCCFLFERIFNYNKFLHNPWTVSLFVVGLYVMSMFYMQHLKVRKKTEFRKK